MGALTSWWFHFEDFLANQFSIYTYLRDDGDNDEDEVNQIKCEKILYMPRTSKLKKKVFFYIFLKF